MDRIERRAVSVTVTSILVALVLSGPVIDGVDLTAPRSRATVSGGNATVEAVSIPAESFHIERGRFGTQAYYLRIPDATVTIESVTGRPRLVYRVVVPELGVERLQTRLLTESADGRVTVRMADRALPTSAVTARRYTGRLVVRVQSFDQDVTVYRRQIDVEVNT